MLLLSYMSIHTGLYGAIFATSFHFYILTLFHQNVHNIFFTDCRKLQPVHLLPRLQHLYLLGLLHCIQLRCLLRLCYRGCWMSRACKWDILYWSEHILNRGKLRKPCNFFILDIFEICVLCDWFPILGGRQECKQIPLYAFITYSF